MHTLQSTFSKFIIITFWQHYDTPDNNESTPFDFNEENVAKIKTILAKYPSNYQQSGIMPLLDLAQRQCGGWVPLAAMNKIAKMLSVPPMKVYEVASFYTMYNRYVLQATTCAPCISCISCTTCTNACARTKVGKHFVQVCTTTPCMLRGSGEIVNAAKKYLHIDLGGTFASIILITAMGIVSHTYITIHFPVSHFTFRDHTRRNVYFNRSGVLGSLCKCTHDANW